VFVAVVVVVVVLLYDYFLNVCSNKCRSSRLVKARAGLSERTLARRCKIRPAAFPLLLERH
jgi:hypothetical protein